MAKRKIFGHLFKEIIIDEGLDLFEVKLVGVALTDLFSLEVKEIEQRLENARHFHDVELFHVQEWLLPVFWDERSVDFSRLITNSRLAWCTSSITISTSASSSALLLRSLGMQCSSFRVVEHLGEQIPLGLLHSLVLLEFIKRLSTFLLCGSFLSSLLHLSNIKSLIGLLVSLFSLGVGHFLGNIGLQIVVLDSLPFFTVGFGGLKSKFDLISSEFTVLTESVDAENVGDFLSSERLRDNLWTDIWLVDIFLTVGFSFVLEVLLLIVPLLLFFLLFLDFSFNSLSISKCSVISFLIEARVILKSNSKVTSKSWHLVEVDSGLSNNFLDKNVLKIFIDNWLTLVIGSWSIVEHIKSESFGLFEDFVDKEIVLRVGMGEMDDLLTRVIDVGSVIIVVGD